MKLAPLLSLVPAVGAVLAGAADDETDFVLAQTRDAHPDDLVNLRHFAQHAAAAYCNVGKESGQALRCNGGACPAVEASGAVVFASFRGNLTDVAGHVTIDSARREILLALRGTSSIRNFLTNLVFAWDDCPWAAGCQLHAGFARAWADVADAAVDAVVAASWVHRGFRIVATGHSLGGAVATIAAAHLKRRGFAVDCYTYGSPRVGNDAFIAFADAPPARHWRVTHRDDPVPRLPPMSFGHRHVSPEYWLANGRPGQDDYQLGDVALCYGSVNANCNGRMLNFSLEAHLHYFGHIAACVPNLPQWRRHNLQVEDEEIRSRLNAWAGADVDLSRDMMYWYQVDINEIPDT